MSKAEERALETYPLMADDDKEGLEALKYIGIECECTSVFNEVQEAKQAYFIEGYHQAEKDLELGWEDVPKIFQISEKLKTSWWFRDNEQTKLIGTQTFWEEVLKRFKEERKEE